METGTKKLVLKYRHLFLLLYYIVIFIWFGMLEKHKFTHYYIIHSPLDDYIHFCKYFILPYFLWFLYIAATLIYLGLTSPRDFVKLILFMFIGMTICYMVYTIWPNQQDLRPQEVLGNDIFARAVRFIYWFDTPTNVCPSMHVMDAIGVNMAILHCKKLKKHHLIQIGSTILAILICASTLFVKQHSVVDVFWGIVLSIILYIPIYILSEIFSKKRRALKAAQ